MILLYIDPGAGSLLIQALIAAVVSVPFFFRNAIRNGVRRIRGEKAAEPAGTSSDSDSE